MRQWKHKRVGVTPEQLVALEKAMELGVSIPKAVAMMNQANPDNLVTERVVRYLLKLNNLRVEKRYAYVDKKANTM